MDNEITKMRLTHLGEIGFRLSLFGLIVAIVILTSSFISIFVVAAVALIGIVLPIITLGMPFAINPNYYTDFFNFLGNSTNVINFLWNITYYVKYIAILGILGSIIGSIFLLSNKNDRHWGKFIFCLISSIICLIFFIFIISGSFQQNIIS